MSSEHEHDPSQLDLWLDGGMDAARAQEFERGLAQSPELASEARRAREIEAALARRFAAPALAIDVPVPPVLPARVGSRAGWLASAAGLLIAFGAGFWFAAKNRQPGEEEPRTLSALTPPTVADCPLDDIFVAAAAGDFEPLSPGELTDAELLGSLDSPTCEGSDELVVVGEWSNALFDGSDIVMLRAGAEPVLLLLPAEDDDSEVCLTSQSPLHLFRGCWRGRPIYELSALEESRVLSCVQALDVESRRF